MAIPMSWLKLRHETYLVLKYRWADQFRMANVKVTDDSWLVLFHRLDFARLFCLAYQPWHNTKVVIITGVN